MSDAVREQVLMEVRAAWVEAGEMEGNLAFDNKEITPSSDYWGRAVIRHLDSGPPTLGTQGNRKIRREAIAVVQIFARKGQGTRRADAIAEAVMGRLEARKIGPANFRSVQLTELPGEGDYFQLNVEAPFDYYETR